MRYPGVSVSIYASTASSRLSLDGPTARVAGFFMSSTERWLPMHDPIDVDRADLVMLLFSIICLCPATGTNIECPRHGDAGPAFKRLMVELQKRSQNVSFVSASKAPKVTRKHTA